MSSNNKNQSKPMDNKSDFKNFIRWGALLFPILIVLNMILFKFMFTPRVKEAFFFILAAAIIVAWLLMLTVYYVWAIYFYNINRGWTDKDWDDQENKVLATGSAPEPDGNPNAGESMGLPPGTIRGTIALSVVVGGMAMMIASLAMPDRLLQNEFLIDHFEFIKTAFIMVIAFYFGSKSLELLSKKQVVEEPKRNSQPSGSPSSTPSTTTTTQQSPLPSNSVVGDVAPSAGPTSGEFEDQSAQG
ncbi:MAG TPA: hypothetical protein VFG46_03240 [Chryseolinea sp.]|nr:hypothetical protein [Chryseolinea sp.]